MPDSRAIGRVVTAPGEGLTLQVLGDAIACKATAADTGSAWEAFEITARAGSGVPLHKHDWDEAYFILDGQLDFQVGEEEVTAATGCFVRIPAGTVHGLANAGPGACRYLLWVAPASVGEFFREIHEASSGALDMDTIVAIADRHGVELAAAACAA